MNTLDNPVGSNGFAFVEFSGPKPENLRRDFLHLGFIEVGRHKQHEIYLYRQGEINFLLNLTVNSHAMQFAGRHGAAATGMGFRVANAGFTKEHAVKKGALDSKQKNVLDLPAIIGVGESLLYFLDDDRIETWFDENFDYHTHVSRKPSGAGLTHIDHLTHNVKWGQMDVWASFYRDIFNFHQIKYFHIKGQKTSLESRAMTSPCGKIRIPINESVDEKSQIVEFLDEFNGEGIQHIALAASDIYHTIAEQRKNGIQFLDTPDTYFDMIHERLPWHKENVPKLKELKILIDGEKTAEKGLLLQIFTENMLGPVFFEIIQRKGNEGFGEGNFQALFEAIERDQMLRGKL